LAEAEDPYVLALVSNALAADNPKGELTRQTLSQLNEVKIMEDDQVYWQSQAGSFMGGQETPGSIETTALAALAFMKAGRYAETVNGSLSYLVAHKDSFGSWHSTQATILALKALLFAATQGGQAGEEAMVRVSLNGEETDPIRISSANADVVHLVTFADKAVPGDNTVEIKVEGERPLMYQIVAEYYLPWDKVPGEIVEEPAMVIEVGYDRTELAINEVVRARAWIELRAKGVARMALVDLGVPPGFSVLTEDLDRLVEKGVIARYEVAGRQIIIYLENLASGQPLEFEYRLRARYPLRAKTPASRAYDYYNPEMGAIEPPQQLVVTE